MKIAISGPPSSLKGKIFNKLKTNPWFVQNKFVPVTTNIDAHLKDEDPLNQLFILNDILRTLVNPNSVNSLHKFSVLDPLSHFFDKPSTPKFSKTQFIASVSPHITKYDCVFCIGNPTEGYITTLEIFAGKENIIQLVDQKESSIYNKIITTTKERLEQIDERKIQDSNMWFSVLGEDNPAEPTEKTL